MFLRIFLLSFFSFSVYAQNLNLGDLANNLTQTFGAIVKLLTAAAYVGGVTFFIVSVFQFKQHKENPTQVPLSKPMMILAMSSALIFLPDFIGSVSQTVFGEQASVGGANGFLPGV